MSRAEVMVLQRGQNRGRGPHGSGDAAMSHGWHMRSLTILLDEGHGNGDPGKTAGTFRESVFALQLGRRIDAALINTGWPLIVWHTRYDDSHDPSQHARADRAEGLKADITLSLHANSSDPLEHGALAFVLPGVPYVQEVAAAWLAAMDRPGEYTEEGTRLVKRMRSQIHACKPGIWWQARSLSVLQPHGSRPAIVLEHEHVSHVASRDWLMSTEGVDRCVYAALEAVRCLFDLVGNPQPPMCVG